jgi:undecaprenyl-diphosphatase
MTGHQWLVLGVGFVVSYIVALAVVAWFMHWVRRHGFIPFAVYRIVLGFLVLILVKSGTNHTPSAVASSTPTTYIVSR